MAHEAGRDWVEQRVEARPEQVAFVVHALRPEALAEDGALATATCVEPRGVATKETLHAVAEVGRRRLEHRVVRVEERGRMNRPIAVERDPEEAGEVSVSIAIVEGDRPTAVSLRDNVVDSTRLLVAEATRHVRQLACCQLRLLVVCFRQGLGMRGRG